MKTPDRDPRLDDPLVADQTPDALDRLIAEIRVPVDAGFSRQLMSRLPARETLPYPGIAGDARGRQRAAGREWTLAAALAAALIAIAAALVAGGAGAEPGVATSIVDLVVATFAAGAGFLAASWRGLGQAVGAALDGSVTALVALGLATLAANGLLVLLLRRRRAAGARTRDES